MDLQRLQRALSLEAEVGFTDLRGREQTFSQFLGSVFGQDPPSDWVLNGDDRRRWKELGSRYTLYSELELPERQHLVAETRRWLERVRRQQELSRPSSHQPGSFAASLPQRSGFPAVGVATTPPEAGRSTISPSLPAGLSLEQPLQFLKGIGPKSAEKLAQLGLHSVRDALYYFPRDYLDYSRRVLIRQAKVGE